MQLLDPLAGLLKVLADPTRLRILAVLERQELSVGELSRTLASSQSRVSNHLRVLRDSDLLAERHDGTSTYLRFGETNGSPSLAAELWAPLRARLSDLPEHAADLGRLEAVLAARGEDAGSFFDRVAPDWDKIGVDFASGQGRQRAAANLLPAGLVLADLGCGTGYFARALTGLCSRLVCVDRSHGMLEEARARLQQAPRGTELEFHVAELDRLPLPDAQLDGLVCGMVLHHLEELTEATAEMFRVLRPGAAAVVLELMPHKVGWMRAEHGDRHLGLEPKDVLAAFARAGFEEVQLEPVADDYRPRRGAGEEAAGAPDTVTGDQPGERPDLPLYIVRGRKPRAK